jgi:hypothetical protein
MGIRDGHSSDPGFRMKKSLIRDKHPGSATQVLHIECTLYRNIGLDWGSFNNKREERKKIRELVREEEINLHTYSRSSSWNKKRIRYRAGEKR